MQLPNEELTQEVSAEELAALLKTDSVRLIDCREEDEFALCRIEGAILIPLQTIPERIDAVRGEGDSPVVVYCHHGMRSLRATQFLRSKGLSATFSLRGGIEDWSQTVDPSVPRY